MQVGMLHSELSGAILLFKLPVGRLKSAPLAMPWSCAPQAAISVLILPIRRNPILASKFRVAALGLVCPGPQALISMRTQAADESRASFPLPRFSRKNNREAA